MDGGAGAEGNEYGLNSGLPRTVLSTFPTTCACLLSGLQTVRCR